MPDPLASEFCSLGDSDMQLHKLKEAEALQDFEFVARLFPEADAKAYPSLALLYRAECQLRQANVILEKGRSIFPEDTMLQALDVKK